LLVFLLTCQTLLSYSVSVKSSLLDLGRSLGSPNIFGSFPSFLLLSRNYSHNTLPIIPHCFKAQFNFPVSLSLLEFCIFWLFSTSLITAYLIYPTDARTKCPLPYKCSSNVLRSAPRFIYFLGTCHTMWHFKVFQRCLINSWWMDGALIQKWEEFKKTKWENHWWRITSWLSKA